ncbi:MAG: undecaprenyl-phosphate galactose phosphotransferase WbaP [Deltaproteobacteria bacterium]|jgi:Undecaprenyl-phosphate galactose phosphotransferase WbaP|nr:undecaprenyl-phosphate galactose phosphotransferase WbaP [Deltaproteobacteria bacterium]
MRQPEPITVLTIAISDFCALVLSFMSAYFLRSLFPGHLPFDLYLKMLPLLLFFMPLYASLRLYPGLLLGGPESLRRLSTATTVGTLFLSGLLFVGQFGEMYSRFVLVFFWLLALLLVPLFRCLTQRLCGHFAWWGYPVLLMGRANLTDLLRKHLRSTPALGYKCVGVFNIDEPNGTLASELMAASTKKYPLLTAALIMNGLDKTEQKELFRLANSYCKRIIVLPDEAFNIKLSVKLAMFCSHITLSMRQNLLDPYRLHMKRFLDLLLVLLFALPLLPVMTFIYLAVRLDSKGPGFYRHTRIGQHGQEIKIWKFRTMRHNADKILPVYLNKEPQLQAEWLLKQKLEYDPRITRIGQCLRKTSLDELPQIFNVFTGEMSLVGPRPITRNEIEKYGEAFELYKQVRPGITGLWQVSGRNNVSYDTRVALDETYIANWSIWLDIYILARTAPAAITGNGAY